MCLFPQQILVLVLLLGSVAAKSFFIFFVYLKETQTGGNRDRGRKITSLGSKGKRGVEQRIETEQKGKKQCPGPARYLCLSVFWTFLILIFTFSLFYHSSSFSLSHCLLIRFSFSSSVSFTLLFLPLSCLFSIFL